MRKGQAAMEFLMTYGWAILVVLIAIGALAYFGVLNPEKFLPEKCVISAGSGIWCDDFSIDSSSQVRLNLKNILTDDMSSVAVTLNNTAGGGTGICTVSGQTISADATTAVTLTCSPALSEKIKADLKLDYTVSSFAKTTTGTITGRVP
ncbi:MAG TPA: hypothetical protein VFF28_00545 [Candidatus Nanoarchaeia archaeon]|nr:hypothetical protein [Candidatus Nanoarchaeia archaeon]